jgi:hypothetical protein
LVVEVELLVADLERSGLDDSLGEQRLHNARIWIGKADQGFLETAKIERRLVLNHRFF